MLLVSVDNSRAEISVAEKQACRAVLEGSSLPMVVRISFNCEARTLEHQIYFLRAEKHKATCAFDDIGARGAGRMDCDTA